MDGADLPGAARTHYEVTVLGRGVPGDPVVIALDAAGNVVSDAATRAELAGSELAGTGFLVPGLVDAHCHVGIIPGQVATAETARVRAVADRDAGTAVIREPGSPFDTRVFDGAADLPRFIRMGRHIALHKRYIPGLGIELESAEQLPAAVAEQVAAGDGWVKLVGDWIDRSVGDLASLFSEPVLREAIAIAHAGGAKVTAHVFGEEALGPLLNAGVDAIEHGTGLTDETIAICAERGVAVVPTLIQVDNFPAIAAGATKYPIYKAHLEALHARADATFAAAREAGVALYAGTDAGGYVEHGRLPDEIWALHRRLGLGMDDALTAASGGARAWLGLPGGITVGEPADFVLYRDDPRTRGAAPTNPDQMVLRGRRIR